ncbi:unnamed protein product [Blepharisma stoltei]|uniref:Uncharacterized protein n=1 Tax=Blepharisma stoltei TaxID=1481888 RepID=A0AAU9IRW9_9CILI|nr:unnamed protein product [Blepharisma stoltei]
MYPINQQFVQPGNYPPGYIYPQPNSYPGNSGAAQTEINNSSAYSYPVPSPPPQGYNNPGAYPPQNLYGVAQGYNEPNANPNFQANVTEIKEENLLKQPL